jgi:hypothetical protein
MIDKDLAHERGRQRKEVGPILQRHAVHIDESQVRLMNERRRLQGVPWGFAPETAARHAAQFVIHDRHQAVERRGISLTPGQKQFGDFVHPFDSLRSLRAGVERLIIRS